MRFRRLSAPIRKALAIAGILCLLAALQSLMWLYRQWHSQDVWMWIDSADSPRVANALRAGCNPNVRGAQGFPALCTASAVGTLPTVGMLLHYGANPNLATPDGNTPLMYACRFSTGGSANGLKFPDIVRLLVTNKADINLCNHKGETALLLACADGTLENVQLLVEHGADVNARDAAGDTPFSLAVLRRHEDVIAYLRQHGAAE